MDRTPRLAIRYQLRREVNYGCPVPGCGIPFLEWHHFDPPWQVREHHNPDGMIALCPIHHARADVGTYGKEELRSFKRNPNTVEFVRARFDWLPRKCLIRVGGCYSVDGFGLRLPTGESLLEIGRDESGLHALSFLLVGEDGARLARMERNLLNWSPAILHDLEISVSGSHLKIWTAARSVGFEFRYIRRTLQECEAMLRRDEVTVLHESSPDLDPDDSWLVTRNADAHYEAIRTMTSANEVARYAQERWQPITSMIVRWQALRLIQEEGDVPCFDLVSCRLFLPVSKRGITIRNGFIRGLYGTIGMSVLDLVMTISDDPA